MKIGIAYKTNSELEELGFSISCDRDAILALQEAIRGEIQASVEESPPIERILELCKAYKRLQRALEE